MMTPTAIHRLGLAALCAALAALSLIAPAAGADPTDPLFVFYASKEKEGEAHAPYPSPGSGFEGPCGLAVDSLGDFYVADYYHHNVDVFDSSREFLGQLFGEDPLDGPCGLAVGTGSDGALYVNNYHRNVVKYLPASFPLAPPPFSPYGAGIVFDSEHPTGVAVDPLTGNIYVNDRTYVAVYEPSGAPVEVGGEPLRIGLGSLQDGYGVAVSAYSGTAGYVYVPDAATNTIKVYDPAIDVENPIETIDGHQTTAGGFVSLRDAAIAIVQQGGRIYVADNLQPEYHEHPEAAIYAFEATGAYAGRLKYNVVDALPPGLAVDNSCALHVPPLGGGICQAEFPANRTVYVTSGDSEEARVCAYAASALTTSVISAPCTTPPAPGGAGATSSPASATNAAVSAAVAAGVGGMAGAAISPRAHHPRRHRVHHHRTGKHDRRLADRQRGKANDHQRQVGEGRR